MYRFVLRAAAALLALGMAAASAAADDRSVCDRATGDESIAACSRLIAQNPKDVNAYIGRAAAYDGKGDIDRVIADEDIAIRLDPKNAIAYTGRCWAYAEKRQYDRAIADCTNAIQLDPKYAIAYLNRGATYGTKGEDDRALADYDKALQLDPQSALAYRNRCAVYIIKKEYDRAFADCDQAIRLNRKDAIAFNSRGAVFEHKGDYSRAIADFDEALRLNPSYALARGNRERIQAALASRPVSAVPVAQAPAPPLPAKRALVIGIDAYPNLARAAQLERAVADAEAVGDKLASLGFQVTRLTSKPQSSLKPLLRGFEDFKKTVARGDMVVLFYAGHGLGLSDGTYLLPADVDETSLEVESTAKRAAINENELTDGLRQARAGIVVAVIDACRNDLFSRAVRRAAGNERGLRPVETDGIFKIYSASEGQSALDRLPGGGDDSKNSVFTRVFLKALGTPGLSLSALGTTVRDEVHELALAADHAQTPAVYDRLVGSTRVYMAAETTSASGR